MRVIGLMSGTSADAIDAALCEWPDDAAVRPFELLAFAETPLPPALRERVHRLAAARVPGPEALRELAALDVALGACFADAAQALLQDRFPADGIAAIASHGQTVAHHPELHASLQLGDPSVIAERSGLPVVADFRARDLAAGGEGAPLAPFFHHAVLGDVAEDRLVLNLGGIANVTWLPAGGDPDGVIAFDVGPANALLDGVVEHATGGAQHFDRDGARAAAGREHGPWLAELLADPYLERPPPKSTGRERYGRAEAEALLARAMSEGVPPEDLLATLVAFTAESVAAAARDFLRGPGGAPAKPARVLVGGGGARNRALMARLGRALGGVPIEGMQAAGVPPDAAEAMAFSLMGRNALLGLPNHLPACTGAAGPRVLGELVPAAGRSPAKLGG